MLVMVFGLGLACTFKYWWNALGWFGVFLKWFGMFGVV